MASPIDVIEATWLVISVTGTAVTWWVLRDAYQDRKAIYSSKANGLLLIDVRFSLWQERRRLLGQLLLDLIGVIAALSPPTTTARTVRSWTFISILMLFNVLFTYNSIAEFRKRKLMLTAVKQQKGEGL